MWVLLLILLTPATGIEKVTVLEKFKTQEECQEMQQKVYAGLLDAYPNDVDFVIKCKFFPLKVGA